LIVNRRFLHQVALSLVTFCAALSASAQGLYAGSKGARTAGRGGAVGAKADDLSAVEYNPAGLARLGKTTLQLSNRFSYNQYKYQRAPTIDSATGAPVYFDEVQNGDTLQALDPLLGVATNFGLKDFGFALSAYAPPGMARLSFPEGAYTVPSEGGQRYMMVAREAEILIYALSGAYKFKDIFGVGATLQWIHVPKLDYSLVTAPVPFGTGGDNVRSSWDMLSEVSGYDPFTFNAILGAWVRPFPFLEFGLSGQVVPAELRTTSTIQITRVADGSNLTLTRQDPTTGVETPADDVELIVPLPLWARFAARYIHNKGDQMLFDLELDVTLQTWSRVDTFELVSNGLVGDLNGNSLPIGDVTIEKYWRDALTVQLGGDFVVVPDKFVARAGFGYESPVAWPEFSDVDFPTGPHLSGSLGGSLIFGGFEIALAYTQRHMLQVDITEAEGRVYQEAPGAPCVYPYNDPVLCPYPGQPSATVNGGTYKSFSHFVNLDLIYQFK
jgi:long-subunit fatty acid transport protein